MANETAQKIAKKIIAVASGKGGVGKSTVAANLALALHKKGKSVALCDADLYGPSIPTLFAIGEDERPTMGADEKSITPLEKYGIKLMSMGFLVPEKEAVIWRGPMLAKMLQQFLQQVVWGNPDYMVIDLPPGTGDIQLTLSQIIPVDGALIVSTPQDLAQADVRRAMRMFEKTNIPLLGLVENMSYFLCPDNGKKYFIFGGEEGKSCLDSLGLELLAQLPLETETCKSGDDGKPIVLASPDSEQAQRFIAIAEKLMESEKNSSDFELPSLKGAYH
jgi:ATP-binding protein involved in chromosome partitioning